MTMNTESTEGLSLTLAELAHMVEQLKPPTCSHYAPRDVAAGTVTACVVCGAELAVFDVDEATGTAGVAVIPSLLATDPLRLSVERTSS